ncbi:Piso0_000775 [Millerozyma farinosa CBS 7064]|uniref:Piso0_000775 protein n=1 Tax=Pichia sorbitophila (strain ATCC MYA-4447 / BCRC 22081 / CBS 7064 / NBRC 10061 / NRRL Y-12695) TaxID=559304 RepID=G8YQ11_PICSO|nr:Piso0_000775 [Millerozyma farinosa CBS 7064]
MKRKWSIELIQSSHEANTACELPIATKDAKRYKNDISRSTSIARPPTLSDELTSPKIPEHISVILEHISSRTIFTEYQCKSYDFIIRKRPKFVFFLGAVGKEYIDDIHSIALSPYISSIFVSSGVFPETRKSFSVSNDLECNKLSSFLQILDPLGGGLYPLDYIMVLDVNDLVRSLLPIRICRNSFHSPHEKFGVDFEKLPGLLEEYKHYLSDYITTSN